MPVDYYHNLGELESLSALFKNKYRLLIMSMVMDKHEKGEGVYIDQVSKSLGYSTSSAFSDLEDLEISGFLIHEYHIDRSERPPVARKLFKLNDKLLL